MLCHAMRCDAMLSRLCAIPMEGHGYGDFHVCRNWNVLFHPEAMYARLLTYFMHHIFLFLTHKRKPFMMCLGTRRLTSIRRSISINSQSLNLNPPRRAHSLTQSRSISPSGSHHTTPHPISFHAGPITSHPVAS